MGLDVVELVMDVERTFSITIDDRDAPAIITVGELYQYVLDRLGPDDRHACLSSAAFYKLRAALCESFGIDRAQVRPETPVAALLPQVNRLRSWRRLEAATGLRLPHLERPAWVYGIVVPNVVIGVVATVGLLLTVRLNPENQIFTRGELMTVAIVGYLLAIGVELATRPLERLLPPGCERVRGLVEAVVPLNFARLRAERQGWTRAEVWTTLQRLVADQFGVAPDTIGEATRFVADLGAS